VVLDQMSGLLNARRAPLATAARHLAHGGRRVALGLVLTAGVLAIGIGSAGATPPVGRQIDANTVVACCACRGTAGGEKDSIKSCLDASTISGCLLKCRSEGAGSLVFGYEQTCSQGCAGLATQGK